MRKPERGTGSAGRCQMCQAHARTASMELSIEIAAKNLPRCTNTVRHAHLFLYTSPLRIISLQSPERGRHSVARILPITRDGFGRCETNGAYRTMILHNCLSGHTARLALWALGGAERSLDTCSMRQAQLARWLAKFVSALVVSVTRPLLLTSSIFFDRVFNLQCAHTSSPRS